MQTTEFRNLKIFKNNKDIYNSEFLLENDQENGRMFYSYIGMLIQYNDVDDILLNYYRRTKTKN